MKETTFLRQTPGDENEIAKMMMHRRRDSSPGNPKWYTAPRIPKTFKFVAGAKPVFPAHVKPNPITKPKHFSMRCIGGPFDGQSLELCGNEGVASLDFDFKGARGRYVKEWERWDWQKDAPVSPKLNWVAYDEMKKAA